MAVRNLRKLREQGVIAVDGNMIEILDRDRLDDLAAGRELGNDVPLASLSSVEVRHLKEAFNAIREMQGAVARRYRTASLG